MWITLGHSGYLGLFWPIWGILGHFGLLWGNFGRTKLFWGHPVSKCSSNCIYSCSSDGTSWSSGSPTHGSFTRRVSEVAHLDFFLSCCDVDSLVGQQTIYEVAHLDFYLVVIVVNVEITATGMCQKTISRTRLDLRGG